MLFPISGIEVNPFIPFIVAFAVSFFTSMGGVFRCVPPSTFSSKLFRLHGALCQRNQSSVQHSSDTKWRLSLYSRRTDAVAVNVGGDHWHFAGSIHRCVGPYQVFAKSQEFQAVCWSGAFVYRFPTVYGRNQKQGAEKGFECKANSRRAAYCQAS